MYMDKYKLSFLILITITCLQCMINHIIYTILLTCGKMQRNCFVYVKQKETIHEMKLNKHNERSSRILIFMWFDLFSYLSQKVWITRFISFILGNLPNASEGIVERTACFLGNLAGNYCVHHLQIRVKDCGSYRVYYLYPTPSNDEAYCFGKQCTCIVYATTYLK